MSAMLFLQHYLTGVVKLLPIVNPFNTIPLLLALTAGQSQKEIASQGRRAAIYAAVILIVSLFVGQLVIDFFGISLPALRIAGGMIISIIGFRMIFPDPAAHTVGNAVEGKGNVDIALIPLALPTLAGPGSIVVVVTASTEIIHKPELGLKLFGFAIGISVILTVTLLCWLVLRSSYTLARLLGDHGIEAIKRIMGFLLVCIGVEYVATGISQFFHLAA